MREEKRPESHHNTTGSVNVMQSVYNTRMTVPWEWTGEDRLVIECDRLRIIKTKCETSVSLGNAHKVEEPEGKVGNMGSTVVIVL